MEFICTKENLYKGIIQVQGVAGQATTLPILKNIFIEAKNGSIKLKTTNLEIGITAQIRGKIEKEGSITADARLLSSFISLLSQENVHIILEGKSLLIETGIHKTKIHGLVAEEFPVIPDIKREKGFKIGVQQFKQALLQVVVAVSSDDARQEISGMFFSIKENILTAAGTDSYRLAEKKLTITGNSDLEESFIIPLKTIKELVRTLTEEDETASVYIDENQVLFSHGETELITRLIDGQYPNYTQIIPTVFNYSFSVLREDLVHAVKIAGLFASVGSNSITFTLQPSIGELTIVAATHIGEERTTLPVKIEGKENISIVFDYRYLLDGLNSITDSEVVFHATSHSSPVIMKPKNETEQFIYIVMPIRQ